MLKPLERAAIQALIPHQGCMCLHDRVEHWDENTIRCSAITHQSGTHPLRRDGQLSAVHLAEYGAQAMAIHGGLLAQRDGGAPAPGMLVSLREMELHVERIDDLSAELTVTAQRLVSGAGGWMYEFAANAAGLFLARGRVSVILRAD